MWIVSQGANIRLECLKITLRKLSSRTKRFPESYQSNTEKEEHMLSCCENFRRQYKLLYRDRKPLFLTPKNECGIEVNCFCKISCIIFGHNDFQRYSTKYC